MSTLAVLIKVLSSASLYKRKILFFTPIILTVLILVGVLSRSQISAEPITGISRQGEVGENIIEIEILKNGRVLVGKEKVWGALVPQDEVNLFKYKVLDNPGFYISNLEVRLHLPQAVSQNQIKNRIYLIGSLNSIQNIFLEDPQTVVFQLTDLSPSATLTIESQLPPQMVTFPWYQQLYYQIYNLSAIFWLLTGIGLPALTFLVLGFLIFRKKTRRIVAPPSYLLDSPPQPVHPAVVGTLPDGRIGSREIAATILSLANRGLLDIFIRNGSFTIGRRRRLRKDVLENLEPFEKTLLSKIFREGIWKVSRLEIEKRIGHHIFSRKIAQMFWEIYEGSTKAGYFEENLGKIHQRWRNTGFWFFFLGVLGFFLGANLAPEPKFVLLFWVGEILASLLVIKLAPTLPTLTSKGKKSLEKWLAFKNFLSRAEPFPYRADFLEIYQKYLPYAMVLGCEESWTKRFQKYPFTPPTWYETTQPKSDINKFTENIFNLIGSVSASLALSHEPTIE